MLVALGRVEWARMARKPLVKTLGEPVAVILPTSSLGAQLMVLITSPMPPPAAAAPPMMAAAARPPVPTTATAVTAMAAAAIRPPSSQLMVGL